MKAHETTLAQSGVTTVPKALRVALGALGGGRLTWTLTAEGVLEVRLKHAYHGQRQPSKRAK
jgi:hypothetical protein